MRELTFEEFCALPMELGMHISGDKEHYLHRYNRETNVNKVVITRKKKNGGFGKSSTIYYLPNEVENYDTADQIYVAYMEKVCGVNQGCEYCKNPMYVGIKCKNCGVKS